MTTVEARTPEAAVERETISGLVRGHLERLRGGEVGLLPVLIGLGVITLYFHSKSSNFTAAGNIDTGRPAIIGQDPTGQYEESGSADIDDLGVWRKALTALEAASIYMAAVSNHVSFTGGP